MNEETMSGLPEQFLEKMKGLLGEEYEDFIKSYEKERVQGLRINPLKESASVQTGANLQERFGLRPIPWAKEGYYYNADTRPGKHPFHEAGAYYIQEPSAMAVAELLDPRPGERILDLCAAPGGKTTQIAGRMMQQGLLISNEIHPARVKILSQNAERFGIRNVVVTNEEPGRLESRFPDFFDKILVDAPCSGEGMFRKDEDARDEWSPDHVVMCARRQAEILDHAAGMLREGGRLVYSTCTFSPEEDEGSIQHFLERHPEFSIEKAQSYEGLSNGHPEWVEKGCEELRDTFRIWPHKAEGEGHYMAVLKKKESQPEAGGYRKKSRPAAARIKDKSVYAAWEEFANSTLTDPGFWTDKEMERRFCLYGEQLYLLPEGIEEERDLKGLKVLRPGLHLGTIKKGRLEPSHALALSLQKEQVIRWYDMDGEGEEILGFLRGETLDAGQAPGQAQKQASGQASGAASGQASRAASGQATAQLSAGNGWTLMLAGGYSTGWAKLVGNTLKNHYPKGLRK